MGLEAIDRLSEADAKRILRIILGRATTPAFGALPLREVNLLLFEALREAGAISGEASLYNLMTSLKITRAKARNLLFDLEIRQSAEGLDARARTALAQPKGFVMDGAYLAFAIENPVVQAHIRDRVASLGHLADASFDPTVVRLKPAAMGALVESLMDENEREAFRKGMAAAGFGRDKSLAAALTAGIEHLAKKYLGETATEIASGYLEDFAKFLMPYARGAIDTVRDVLKGLGETPPDAPPQIRRL